MANPHAITVYYPFALTDLVRLVQGDDFEETGDVLLVMLDEEGCQVTLRLRPEMLSALAARIQSPPDPKDGP
jgi:hypothetical protein